MKIFKTLNLILGICFLVGCHGNQRQNKVTMEENTELSVKPRAILTVSSPIDMGEFQGDELKKTNTISIRNTGNDTLYIIGAEPDCLCTEVQVIDSVIAPLSNGRLRISLDLTEYPSDTIYKDVAIISNDSKDRVKRFQVMGIRK
jgi:hypothetical protein